MDFSSFSHGQIVSKIWLCEEFEKYIPHGSDIHILGCWYNILAFMLLVRNNTQINSIKGVDIDPEVIPIASRINDAWQWTNQTPFVININSDAREYISGLSEQSIIINCSPEHFDTLEWFTCLPKNSLVCIQSSSVVDPNGPWFIKQPTKDFDSFINLYSVKELLFSGTKRIQYSHFGYDRYMLIGRT